ncbi:TIGR03986 family CRISPR-associated RAMP protein [Frankia sp. AgB1.9]|uniref:TIGR03986 family type III CRISPR-associated RAMP protein n=1 Tax=unclassified Frankia TaxID=2632575 RepID=UPI001933F000|nr:MULTISPECIES: TIGR03986 family CRISPR-associated RAMP protein [unclassified Frankia]MBL7487456.1 TIGR03986 family CRISPR-associated RAMP protein [Frankia sp. AgW1.1]MBL7547418.1 TIGR03986 family CRISPR-associated RAMP protein [Frankia sp. AgB1.9]MBL7618807.1 TIGR03986 family CRISPR-associated RAMP protein [Frankia sp. AgB1.8]
MADVRTGRLGWRERPDGTRELVVVVGGKSQRLSRPERELTDELRKLYEDESPELAKFEVDFEHVKAQPRRVRRHGEPWVAPGGGADATRRAVAPADGAGPVSAEPLEKVRTDAFLNPYTFVPALPRPALAKLPPAAADLGDRLPSGHDRLDDDLWTGQIGVRMTVHTPLLLLDTPAAVTDDKGHTTYGPLLRGGAVHLPSTAVKGLLRASYEAVTNSRFGVFAGHEAPLGHRMSASAGLGMVPARVSDDGESLELLTGTAPLGQRTGSQAVMYAAWLPAYPPFHREVPIVAERLPGWHTRKAAIRLRLVQHHRWDKRQQTHVADFRYWRVTAITPDGQGPGTPSPALTRATTPADRRSWHEVLPDTLDTVGWVSVSNRNFSRKHDERVFFGTPVRRELTKRLRTDWTNLVENYRYAHRHADIWGRRRGDEVAKPHEWLDGEAGKAAKTGWSRHQYAAGAERLSPGDLCYARLDARGDVTALFPVMIARELFAASPLDLLHPTLRPAAQFDALSPADRVFGWVHQRGPSPAGRDDRSGQPAAAGRDAGGRRPRAAYGGQLRVGPASFRSPDGGDGLDRFEGRGVPLAILGQPKPQQGRFYVAAGSVDAPAPLPDRTPRSAWYASGRSLRGRKTYPHHAGLAPDYWSKPSEDRTQTADGRGRYQEYRRPHQAPDGDLFTPGRDAFAVGTTEQEEQRDNQNRSVTAWVRPGGEFRFTLDVRNLSNLELGALLWLLRRPADEYHRFGLGKPLGFGSVHLDLDTAATHLRRGDDWRRHYVDFSAELPGENPDFRALAGHFEKAVAAVWRGAPQLAAFRAAAQGDPTVPVHYPRVRPAELDVRAAIPPDPRGQSFQWFVQNEQERAGTFVRAVSLPPADGDPLPIHPAPEGRGAAGQGRAASAQGHGPGGPDQARRPGGSDRGPSQERRASPPPAVNRVPRPGPGPRPGPPRNPGQP